MHTADLKANIKLGQRWLAHSNCCEALHWQVLVSTLASIYLAAKHPEMRHVPMNWSVLPKCVVVSPEISCIIPINYDVIHSFWLCQSWLSTARISRSEFRPRSNMSPFYGNGCTNVATLSARPSSLRWKPSGPLVPPRPNGAVSAETFTKQHGTLVWATMDNPTCSWKWRLTEGEEATTWQPVEEFSWSWGCISMFEDLYSSYGLLTMLWRAELKLARLFGNVQMLPKTSMALKRWF